MVSLEAFSLVSRTSSGSDSPVKFAGEFLPLLIIPCVIRATIANLSGLIPREPPINLVGWPKFIILADAFRVLSYPLELVRVTLITGGVGNEAA
jgi:hypothetical protein